MRATSRAFECSPSSIPTSVKSPEPQTNSRLLRIQSDYARSTLWISISKDAPPFISSSLLDDLVRTTKPLKGYATAPLSFRVLSSAKDGVFSLGGDLRFFLDCIDKRNDEALRAYAHNCIDAIWENVSGSGYPDLLSISLVQGEAQGGGFEAALSSHLLVAEAGSHFGFPESMFGLFPGMGAFDLLACRVSESAARKLIGSAKRYSAEELFDLKVVDILAHKGRGEEAVREFINSASQSTVESLRRRCAGVSKIALLDTVDTWVEQALDLTEKHKRTIRFILQAQERHFHDGSHEARNTCARAIETEAAA